MSKELCPRSAVLLRDVVRDYPEHERFDIYHANLFSLPFAAFFNFPVSGQIQILTEFLRFPLRFFIHLSQKNTHEKHARKTQEQNLPQRGMNIARHHRFGGKSTAQKLRFPPDHDPQEQKLFLNIPLTCTISDHSWPAPYCQKPTTRPTTTSVPGLPIAPHPTISCQRCRTCSRVPPLHWSHWSL